jgi:hypothetical protein
MATEQQIAANRLNALLSSGPRTNAGKNVSRMNALRHGITGQLEATTPEEKEAKDKFFAGIISSLAPEGFIENQFAHSVADGHWRLNRASSIEDNIFTLARSAEAAKAERIRAISGFDAAPAGGSDRTDDTGETEDPEVDKALSAARVFIADPKRFQLLTIYEGRIHRNMMKSLQQLTDLQAARHAAEAEHTAKQNALREQVLEEACLLTQLDEMEGTSCDSAASFTHPNGFVFSNAEIAQSIRHLRRLEAARKAFPLPQLRKIDLKRAA